MEQVKHKQTEEIKTRLKTSFIISCGVLFIPAALILVLQEHLYLKIGGAILIFLAPAFLLYPLIRFLFFGGKDSVAVVTATVTATVIAEQVLFGAIVHNAIKRKEKK